MIINRLKLHLYALTLLGLLASCEEDDKMDMDTI